MAIKVILRNKEIIIEETKDLTVRKVFKKLDLLPETYLCVRNGELITEQELLKDGDIIRLVPVISGG
ncbi:MAG TPA: MoaD/ThiS family protein [Anaerolineaceae bacterium]|nr:MoaD/ThiS family protein [Anaerolineaceae bacterium]